MSTETLLSGDITLKDGMDYGNARRLAEKLSGVTETTCMEGYVSYDFYLEYIFNKMDLRGKALIVCDHDGTFSIEYSDVSWSSHIYDHSWDELKKKLYENREIIKEVSLSLWYLNEPDMSIYVSEHSKPDELGSWDELKGKDDWTDLSP